MDNFSVSGWFIYLITRLDPLKEFLSSLTGIGCISVGIFFVVCIFSCMDSPPSELKNKMIEYIPKWWKKFILLLIFLGFLSFLTPTSKEMLAIWLVPTVANNADVQSAAKEVIKLPKNILEGTNKLLEDLIKEKADKEPVKSKE